MPDPQWIVLNERDMLMGEFATREEANTRCRELNAKRNGMGMYTVAPAPGGDAAAEFYGNS